MSMSTEFKMLKYSGGIIQELSEKISWNSFDMFSFFVFISSVVLCLYFLYYIVDLLHMPVCIFIFGGRNEVVARKKKKFNWRVKEKLLIEKRVKNIFCV